MAGTTPIYGFPYPESSDLVANYPALGQQLAEDVEDVLAAGIGKVLQVVSTFKNDTFSSSSTSFVDITGMSVSITPTAATSKILVQAILYVSHSSSSTVRINLLRGATNIAQPSAGADASTAMAAVPAAGSMTAMPISFLDSPATTSAVTYKLQTSVFGDTGYINQSASLSARTAVSTITVMEVSA